MSPCANLLRRLIDELLCGLWWGLGGLLDAEVDTDQRAIAGQSTTRSITPVTSTVASKLQYE
jgi:hypothetical protein